MGKTRSSGTSSTEDRAHLEAPVSSAHPGSGTELKSKSPSLLDTRGVVRDGTGVQVTDSGSYEPTPPNS